MNQIVQTVGTMLKPGDLVGRGRYIIQKFLGSGTMARVYHALDTQISLATGTQDRALKILDPQETATRHDISEQEAINDFNREARILLHSTHRNVVRAYDHFVENGFHVLVLEYVEGVTLDALKKMRTVSEEEVIVWVGETFDMLEDLHAKGLVYRDLKLGNMMVRPDNHITFIDFGTARDVGVPIAQGVQANGTAVGTPGYAAPEQWSGKLDIRSDLYALGVIMKELLTGNDPIVFDTQPLTGYRLELCSFVNKATKLDANERYQTVDEMRRGLEGTKTIVSQVVAGTTVIQPQSHKPSLEEVWNEIMRVKMKFDSGMDWTFFGMIWISGIEFEKRGCLIEASNILNRGLKDRVIETSSAYFAYGMTYEWFSDFKEAIEYYRGAVKINVNLSEAYDGIARVEAKMEQERQDEIAKKLAKKIARNAKMKQVGGAMLPGIFWLGRQLDPRSVNELIDIEGKHSTAPHIAILLGVILGFIRGEHLAVFGTLFWLFFVFGQILFHFALLCFQVLYCQIRGGNSSGEAFGFFVTATVVFMFSLALFYVSFSSSVHSSLEWGPRVKLLIGYTESRKPMRDVLFNKGEIPEKEWIYDREDGAVWISEYPKDTEQSLVVLARNAAEARGKVAKVVEKNAISHVFFERHRQDTHGKIYHIWRVVLKTI
ncbi:MAG: protein kinase [Parcubacteria group bacterium]|nr:protein kinase [Parcubacteria group bacterium]